MIRSVAKLILPTLVVLAGLGYIASTFSDKDDNGGTEFGIDIDLDVDEDDSEDGDGTDDKDDVGPEMTDPFNHLHEELSRLYLTGELSTGRFQHVMAEHRVGINVMMVELMMQKRTPWLSGLTDLLKAVGRSVLILLLGPFWLFYHFRKRRDRLDRSLESIPYFVASAAVTLFFIISTADLLVSVQEFQMTAIAFGSPRVAMSDATIHFLANGGSAQLDSMVAMVIQSRNLLISDPLSGLGLMQHLYMGAHLSQESAVFGTAADVMSQFSIALELVGPLLALATGILAVQVLVPFVKELTKYPYAVATREVEPGWRRFVRRHIRTLVQVFLAAIFMFTFILFFSALVIVGIRILAFPMTYAAIDVLLAGNDLLSSSNQLPDSLVLASVVSMSIFFITIAGLLFAPMGLVLGNAHLIVWEKLRTRRKFRSFKPFWRLTWGCFRHVFLPTFLIGLTVSAVYVAALLTEPGPTLRLWLPLATFTPLGIALIAWRRVLRHFVRLARMKVVGETPPAGPGRGAL